MISTGPYSSTAGFLRGSASLRTLYQLHIWIGACAGWLLFAVCLSGTLVVYKYPLKVLSNPSISSSAPTDRIGPDGALALAQAHYPEARPQVVAFPSDIYSIHAYSVVLVNTTGKRHRIWIDPASGRVHDALESDFADFLLRLHGNLFLGRPGRWLVGFLGLAMVVSLISGLWFHWRRLRRDLSHLRLLAPPRKTWGDLHKAAGVWLFPVYLVIALTGAWLGLESLVGVSASGANPIERRGEGPGQPLSITEIVKRSRSLNPKFSPTHVNMADVGSAGATIRVQGDLPGYRLVQRGQTMFVFDADSGDHLQTIDRTSESVARRLLAMVRPLHYGYFWPFWGELLYFLAGAGSTLLAVSGSMIWAARKRQRLCMERTASTGLERANVAVIGGLLLALSVMAVLNGLARLIAPQSLNFMGTHSLLAPFEASVELYGFLLLWTALGVTLFWTPVMRAWSLIVTLIAIFLLMLPLAGIALSGFSDYLRVGDGEALGYIGTCLLLSAAALGVNKLIARRGLSREVHR